MMRAIILIIYLHTCYAGFYKASVVDYLEEPVFDGPRVVLTSNSERIHNLIYKSAEQGSKIVVFPEASFTTSKVYKLSKDQLKRYSMPMPSPDEFIIPCGNGSTPKQLQKISCAAQRNEIYVVINALELSNGDFYNTNIVFDTEGRIVWKQRKNVNNVLDGDNNADFLFETSFGAKFAMLRSYEIFNYTKIEKAIEDNISNFIISSAWNSGNGTTVKSITYYRSMAQKYNINLLLSELRLSDFPNNISDIGSGIFSGGKVETTETETHSKIIGTSILSAIVENPLLPTPSPQTLKYNMDADDLESLLTRFEPTDIKENGTLCTISNHTGSMKFYSEEKLEDNLNVFLCAVVMEFENTNNFEVKIETPYINAYPFTNVTDATYIQDRNHQSIRVETTKPFAIGFYLISIPSLTTKKEKIMDTIGLRMKEDVGNNSIQIKPIEITVTSCMFLLTYFHKLQVIHL